VAIGALDIGVPSPGATGRLANVITLPEHSGHGHGHGHGHGTMLLPGVASRARSIAADRVDLSATPPGQRTYQKPGLTATSALRMQFVL
jgi:GNAT superfamily N-acetyltransferase